MDATKASIASVPAIEVSSLGIDISNPAFANYDFTIDKRFPRTVTSPLDGSIQSIAAKIDSKNPSANNRELLYTGIISALDTRIRTTTDIKEQKILQYIRNHLYIRQQQEKIR